LNFFSDSQLYSLISILERTIKAVNRNSGKYLSLELIHYDKFFDFKIDEKFLEILNSSNRKYKIISVSGHSGVGKSMAMNMIISLLHRQTTQLIREKISYVDVFKVGNGMSGETSGINCNIVNLDNENGLILLDMQGNNDDKEKENFKFLYYSLFFFSFLISDFHFFFYSGNSAAIKQSDIISIINKKQLLIEKADNPNLWSTENELILVNNKIVDMSKQNLQKFKEEHQSKANLVYANAKSYYKDKIFFIHSNEHFDSLRDPVDGCIYERLICQKCQKKETFAETSEISQYILNSHNEKRRTSEKIKQNMAAILGEMQKSRYFICYQSNLDLRCDEQFVKEYLKNVRWVQSKQKERIERFDFKDLFISFFNYEEAIYIDEKKFYYMNEIMKVFAKLYLTSVEFSRFINKNLMENGNDILRKEEAIFFKTDFMEQYENDFKTLSGLSEDFSGFHENNPKSITISKIAKQKLSDLHEKIKGEKVQERVRKELGFWSRFLIKLRDLIGLPTDAQKYKIINYLLVSVDSIEEIIKMQGRASDKFESLYVICGLNFMSFLISDNLKEKIKLMVEKIKDMIANVRKSVTELQVIAGEAGFKKNKDILVLLIAIQEMIEEFLKQNRNHLKIMLNP